MTGRMLDERLGKWHFWLMVIGFHCTFDVMHIPGLLGMPRQIYTYEPDRGWTLLNQIVSVGGFIQAIAVAILVYNLVHSYFRGKEAGPDPWDAWTLEWVTTSPPPAYNFAIDPVVAQPAAAVGPEASGRSGSSHWKKDERADRNVTGMSTIPMTHAHGHAATGLAAAVARTCRHVLADHGGVGDLHDLRGGVPLLPRPEHVVDRSRRQVLELPIFDTICLLVEQRLHHARRACAGEAGDGDVSARGGR